MLNHSTNPNMEIALQIFKHKIEENGRLNGKFQLIVNTYNDDDDDQITSQIIVYNIHDSNAFDSLNERSTIEELCRYLLFPYRKCYNSIFLYLAHLTNS